MFLFCVWVDRGIYFGIVLIYILFQVGDRFVPVRDWNMILLVSLLHSPDHEIWIPVALQIAMSRVHPVPVNRVTRGGSLRVCTWWMM